MKCVCVLVRWDREREREFVEMCDCEKCPLVGRIIATSIGFA